MVSKACGWPAGVLVRMGERRDDHASNLWLSAVWSEKYCCTVFAQYIMSAASELGGTLEELGGISQCAPRNGKNVDDVLWRSIPNLGQSR